MADPPENSSPLEPQSEGAAGSTPGQRDAPTPDPPADRQDVQPSSARPEGAATTDGAAPADTGIASLTAALASRLRSGESVRVDSLEAEFSLAPNQIAQAIQAIVSQVQAREPASPGREPLPARIGRYRIARMLGAGSFGIVYEAFDDQLQRTVAIKLARRLPKSFNSKSYLDEARFLARLDHPGIVPVYDVGRLENGDVYIVSKYVSGEDLAHRLRTSQLLGCTQAAGIVAKVAAALANAHEHGVVHRDIKPSNILLTEDDEPVVVDFGLALKDSDFGRGAQFVGTPAYMSPEQARQEGHRVDGRADIYSLGAVFYEMLTGSRPFKAESIEDLLDLIRHVEVRPPRQLNRAIPRELDRVCLKALAKRVSDRYSSAADMAADLSAWRSAESATAVGSGVRLGGGSTFSGTDHTGSDQGSSPRSKQPVTIVPRGLRSFEDVDADFFLELLPGPRDRDGFPECVRFWRSRICERDPDRTFAVGVLMGPSGSGKSSLLRAGVIPHLDSEVVPILVETKPQDTADRVLRRIQTRLPALEAARSLREALVEIRRNRGLPAGRKLLLVFDQFEQWLSQHPPADPCELSDALRQCDGARLQAILLTRDDFALAITQFMDAVEQPLSQNDNFATVDLFGREHAKKVLQSFGLAFGAIDTSPSRDQQRFLDQAVDGLLHDGQLAPIQLALLAEMMRDKPWTPATLRQAGGTQGIGYAFLQEKLEPGPNSHPLLSSHPELTRKLLDQLLPGGLTPLKGEGRTRQQLSASLSAWGDAGLIDRVIAALDKDLRLLTAAETSDGGDSQSGSRDPSYHLAHDYLVPAIRDWIARTERGTQAGRTRLRLKEIADIWTVRPTPKSLPTTLEWVQINWFTRRRDWTDAQRKMMRSATRRTVWTALTVFICLAALAWGSWRWRGSIRANGLRDRLLVADTSQAHAIIELMRPYRRWVAPLLQQADRQFPPAPAEVITKEDRDAFRQRLNLALALTEMGKRDSAAAQLLDAIAWTEPEHLETVAMHYPREALADLKDKFVAEIESSSPRALAYGAVLSAFRDADEVWLRYAEPLTTALLDVRSFELPVWTRCYAPVHEHLCPTLIERLRTGDVAAGRQRDNLLELLARYLNDSPSRLAEAISFARSSDLASLLPPMRRHGAQGVGELMRLAEAKQPAPAQPAVPPNVNAIVQSRQGRLWNTGGLAFRVTLAELEAVLEQLAQHGYRPNSIRAHDHRKNVKESVDDMLVAVSWVRDRAAYSAGGPFTIEQLENKSQELQQQGMALLDVDSLSSFKEPGMLVALWVDAKGQWETQTHLQQSPADFESTKTELSKAGFVAWRYWSGVKAGAASTKELVHNAIWRRDVAPQTEARASYLRSMYRGEWGDVYPDFFQLDCRLEAASHDDPVDLLERHASFANGTSTSERLNSLLAALQLGAATQEGVAWLDTLIKQRPESSLYCSLRILAADHSSDQATLLKERKRLGALIGWEDSVGVQMLSEPAQFTAAAAYLVAGTRVARLTQPRDAQLAAQSVVLLEQLLREASLHIDGPVPAKLRLDVARGLSLATLSSADPSQRQVWQRRAFELLSLAAQEDDLRPSAWQDVDFSPLRRDAAELTEQWLAEQGWDVRCLGTWAFDSQWETQLVHDATIPEQLNQPWPRRGYHPLVAESVDTQGQFRTSVIWRRPRAATLEQVERNQQLAIVTVALAALGSNQWLLAALDDTHGHEVRSYVIAMSHPAGVPANRLVDAALQESRAHSLRNLCLALGQYPFAELPVSQQEAAKSWVQLLATHVQPGVAQAASWCAQQWGVELAAREAPQGARWSMNSMGQVLVDVDPEPAVLLGSPYGEPDRDRSEQWMWHQIPRRYAIAATETTVAQFARFLESDRGQSLSHSFETSLASQPSCPQISVNWFDAARFCQWLSEEEGLPAEQWCYPNIWDSEEEQWRLPDNYLSRTGYRLPTEAEWEYACRAGTLSSRSFGDGAALLGNYAWYGRNSGGASHPVATRMPNDFGLFDMYGNVVEWCQETSRSLRIPRRHFARRDSEDTELTPRYGAYRVVRGGDYRAGAAALRSGNRLRTVPRDNRVTLGFRITRTLSPAD